MRGLNTLLVTRPCICWSRPS